MSPAPLQTLTALAALAGAALAGCGAEPAARRVDGSALAVTQRDYRFRPDAVQMGAGRIRVDVVNRGRLPHALRLVREGSERLKITTVLPGERGSARTTLTRGTYRMLCPIGNHEELGMYGVLTLR